MTSQTQTQTQVQNNTPLVDRSIDPAYVARLCPYSGQPTGEYVLSATCELYGLNYTLELSMDPMYIEFRNPISGQRCFRLCTLAEFAVYRATREREIAEERVIFQAKLDLEYAPWLTPRVRDEPVADMIPYARHIECHLDDFIAAEAYAVPFIITEISEPGDNPHWWDMIELHAVPTQTDFEDEDEDEDEDEYAYPVDLNPFA